MTGAAAGLWRRVRGRPRERDAPLLYGNGNSEVYVMDVNGKGQRNLTRKPAFDTDPAGSPDGGKIAFAGKRDGTYGVHVMNADGSGHRRLAQHCP